MWIDVPLVSSGFLLLAYVMVWQLGDVRFDGVLSSALLAFAFAAMVMAVFHACEWCKSLSKLREINGQK